MTPPVKRNFSEWQCLTCEGNPEFKTREAAIEHISSVHGGVTQGTKSMLVHMDFARGCWESRYEWDFGTFKMFERTGQTYEKETIKQ